MSDAWKSKFPSGHKHIKKYRPYLTQMEVDSLIELCSNQLLKAPLGNTDTQEFRYIESARQTLLKLKLMSEAELQKPAYVTNPSPTMMEKLGFQGFHGSEGQPIEPNFDEMMKQITGGNPSTND